MCAQPWIGRQVAKLVVFSSLLLFIINQYVNPTVANSPHPLAGSAPRVIERVLKLSIPTLYVWLCMFYCFFHLWLNILAELLRFGDREFYKVSAPPSLSSVREAPFGGRKRCYFVKGHQVSALAYDSLFPDW